MADGLDAVRAELLALEPVFHHPDRTGRTEADVRAHVVPDFWEVGASGTVYDLDAVLAALAQRYADGAGEDGDELPVDDVRCRHLGGTAYLLTYRLRQGDRVTRRATVWDRAPGTPVGWRAVYHQGTVVTVD